MKNICPKCNKSFPVASGFCDIDGSALITSDLMTPKCIKCETEYSADVKYCAIDGFPVIAKAFRYNQPKSVYIAITLFLISLFLGVVNLIIKDAKTESYDLWNPPLTNATTILFLIIFLSFQFFLIYKISVRKKWAQITYLVLSILGMLTYPFALYNLFKFSPLCGIISLICFALNLLALILLFNKKSNKWFNLK
jgi:hypothetical protein